MTKPPRVLVAAWCAVVIACGGKATNTTSGPAGADGSSIVIRGSELAGSLLDGLRTRLPTMRVNTENTACPAITFRGPRSIRNPGNPTVYVDGTLMADTCILQQINSAEVERVVIYPSGHAAEPGIQQNAFGIIMVHRVR